MIQLKPELEILITCPACQSQRPAMREILIQSPFALVDCTCGECGLDFYQTLPVGHTVDDTLSIGKSDRELHPSQSKRTWLSEALLKAHRRPKQDEVAIQ